MPAGTIDLSVQAVSLSPASLVNMDDEKCRPNTTWNHSLRAAGGLHFQSPQAGPQAATQQYCAIFINEAGQVFSQSQAVSLGVRPLERHHPQHLPYEPGNALVGLVLKIVRSAAGRQCPECRRLLNRFSTSNTVLAPWQHVSLPGRRIKVGRTHFSLVSLGAGPVKLTQVNRVGSSSLQQKL